MRKMLKRRSVLVLICSLMSGCMYVPKGSEVYVSLFGPPTQDNDDLALNPFTVSESELNVSGELVTSGGEPDKSMYRDISVRFYRENGELICSHPIGDWDVAEGRKEVSFSTTALPKFVVLYSEDFWKEPMTVDYFVFDSERQGFEREEASSQSELPVSVSERDAPAC